MGRRAGLAKTGGRVRGTPNKQTDALLRKLRKLGCDPLEGLARIALDPQTDVALKVRCYAELAQYVYPKRKAIDGIADSAGEIHDSDGIKVNVEFIGARSSEFRESSPSGACVDPSGLPVPFLSK